MRFLPLLAFIVVGCRGADDPSTVAVTDGGTPGDDALIADGAPADGAPADAVLADAAPADASGLGPRGLFPSDHFFYKDVSASPAATDSAAILARLGTWGNGDRFQIDLSIVVLTADASTPTHKASSIDIQVDSDDVPFPFPVGGSIEGENGYACTGGGDCHLLVIRQDTRKLYEGYSVNLVGSTLTMYSTAVWDLDKHYGPKGRGAGCTSADAAGFPIVPGLIGLDEVDAGEIRHALRFILPNDRMRRHAYVAPATHYGAPSNRNADSIPYGARLRLKPSFDPATRGITSKGGLAIVAALKKYGMLLSDGGNIALTGESDKYSAKKWKSNGGTVDLTEQDVIGIKVPDFEVVDYGTVNQAYPLANATNEWPDCIREP